MENSQSVGHHHKTRGSSKHQPSLSTLGERTQTVALTIAARTCLLSSQRLAWLSSVEILLTSISSVRVALEKALELSGQS